MFAWLRRIWESIQSLDTMALEERAEAMGSSVVEEIPPEINRKYRRTSPTTFACRACGSNVECLYSIQPHDDPVEYRDSAGFIINSVALPYCPKCEPVPWPPWPESEP